MHDRAAGRGLDPRTVLNRIKRHRHALRRKAARTRAASSPLPAPVFITTQMSGWGIGLSAGLDCGGQLGPAGTVPG